MQGLAYYLRPDLSKLSDVGVFSAALGQAFFSLSLGMGAMITYGSYLSKREGLGRPGLGSSYSIRRSRSWPVSSSFRPGSPFPTSTRAQVDRG